ncbi:MAG: acyl-CoA dehydrogenase [Proteobacteria bacterium]|nr:acyl-CoA dehydrogenase [Pseudomonadota bacterium]
MDTEQIRQHVRDWLTSNWNPNLDLVRWRELLADSGWGAPDWPSDYFGRDLDPQLSTVVEEELARIGAIGAAHSGVRMLAAVTLLAHGSHEQKQQYLRRILTGEDHWCQLFSEPGSGSDLAGATTRADLDGDEWIINGQKVWNTSAHHAHYGLLLARSDWDEPKHKGLSYFILDMHQPGVEVRQLKQMNGHASFNEVFFTDARVPRANIISTPGDGWQVAMTTLAYERRSFDRPRNPAGKAPSAAPIYQQYQQELAIANEPYKWYPQRAGRVDLVLQRAHDTGAINDPVIRQDIARLHILAESTKWTAQRARAAQKAGKPQGPEGSLGKLAASNIGRLAARVHTDISANDVLLTGPDSVMQGTIAEILVSTPAGSIAGGTDEIQRNIIAERVLGLPKEPRFDTGPFRDVPRNSSTKEQ